MDLHLSNSHGKGVFSSCLPELARDSAAHASSDGVLAPTGKFGLAEPGALPPYRDSDVESLKPPSSSQCLSYFPCHPPDRRVSGFDSLVWTTSVQAQDQSTCCGSQGLRDQDVSIVHMCEGWLASCGVRAGKRRMMLCSVGGKKGNQMTGHGGPSLSR